MHGAMQPGQASLAHGQLGEEFVTVLETENRHLSLKSPAQAIPHGPHVCASCLGNLGLFGNSLLQFMHCYVMACACKLSLAVPEGWRHRRYFAQLQGGPDSAVAVVPDAYSLSLPITADRVVLSHAGFKTWAAGLEPYTSIVASLGLPTGSQLSGRQLRQHFPQVTPDMLQQQEVGQSSALHELLDGRALWGYFQHHTSTLAPHRQRLRRVLRMARERQLAALLERALQQVLLGAAAAADTAAGSADGSSRQQEGATPASAPGGIHFQNAAYDPTAGSTSSTGGASGSARRAVRLIVCHVRRGDFQTQLDQQHANHKPQPLQQQPGGSQQQQQQRQQHAAASAIPPAAQPAAAPPRAASGMRTSPPFEEGQGQSWEDKSGVFFACPEAWFVQALQSPLVGLRHLQAAQPAASPPLPVAAAPATAPGSDAGAAGSWACSAAAPPLDVLWLCTDDPELAASPRVGPYSAVSCQSLGLRPGGSSSSSSHNSSTGAGVSGSSSSTNYSSRDNRGPVACKHRSSDNRDPASVNSVSGTCSYNLERMSIRDPPGGDCYSRDPPGSVSHSRELSSRDLATCAREHVNYSSCNSGDSPNGDSLHGSHHPCSVINDIYADDGVHISGEADADVDEEALLMDFDLDPLEADFFVMRHADVLLASNSTLSFCAAMLNARAAESQSLSAAAAPAPSAPAAAPSELAAAATPVPPAAAMAPYALAPAPAATTARSAIASEAAAAAAAAAPQAAHEPLASAPPSSAVAAAGAAGVPSTHQASQPQLYLCWGEGPLFLRPDPRAGALVAFNPWDALPILPSLKVGANHSLHTRDKHQQQ